MIKCLISDCGRFRPLSSEFACAIDWLMGQNIKDIAPGTYMLDCSVKVNCEEPQLRHIDEAMLESHLRYADIHVPISGCELVGLAHTVALSHPVGPYDAEKDIRFYNDPYSGIVELNPGEILIVFPEDAHAPNIGKGAHKKLCIKVPISNS